MGFIWLREDLRTPNIAIGQWHHPKDVNARLCNPPTAIRHPTGRSGGSRGLQMDGLDFPSGAY